ncbi:phospholipase effector Tle1 domain-containing protein [Pedobacter mendelii]|uniref:T6SS Phospholipase effector Tle1-like catalytic domain-containing protein n=1 Tax=Pedobacter mendelii TaxID=1908240 RepID=A0ABQ2BQ06_9SPHI|nr:DUF2235 domain-containing protein [Pedobacter mendelii]GGI29471.1 hypothetical protein GCM10008119_37790 [Pedobacter mendelii]
MGNGNIIKIANGNMQDVAKQAHTSFAKTIDANAAKNVNETSTNGVVFGEPEKMNYTTIEGVDIIAGVFFDGTLNNRTNTETRTKPGTNDSYGNGYTNVARLSYQYKEDAKTVYVYTEGIGTENGKSDSTMGYAYGSGPTGVIAKVLQGCKYLADKIKPKVTKGVINTLTLDVFGFSRGSAAARNFVYEVSKGAYLSKSGNRSRSIRLDAHGQSVNVDDLPAHGELGKLLGKIKIKRLVIRFVGLYDTVSSYNEGFSTSPNFANDVEELQLNQLHRAQRVIHFTADDEHRENFSLTRIQSAGANGLEKDLPGVHSDVGGSYENGEEYIDELLNGGTAALNTEKQRLIDHGWYLENQLTVHNFKGKLSGRRQLRMEYSYIPLHFMAEFALKLDKGFPFLQSRIENTYKVPTDTKYLLGYIKARLRKYVFDNGEKLVYRDVHRLKRALDAGKINLATHNQLASEQRNLYILRNKYLHWSANFDWVGMDPNMENNQRVRRIYNG